MRSYFMETQTKTEQREKNKYIKRLTKHYLYWLELDRTEEQNKREYALNLKMAKENAITDWNENGEEYLIMKEYNKKKEVLKE